MGQRGRRAPARNVRVYTVNDESRYVVARNIPAVGVVDEALKRLSLFGDIEDHRVLPRSPEEAAAFTESVWVKYETVNNARHAKTKAKLKPVVGNVLEVKYAPQDETPEDTASKLRARRELLERRAMPRGHSSGCGREGVDRVCATRRRDEQDTETSEFIGPRLPPPSHRRAAAAAAAPTPMVPRAVDRSKRRRI